MADAWIEWLNLNTDTRNQLACYLRETAGLIDQCKFLWAGAAVIGIHVTQPFTSMLLDHKVTPRDLLVILPQLYQDLKSYPKSLCTITACGIPALEKYFLNPLNKETSVYGTDVSQGLSGFLQSCDKDLMDVYLKTVCLKLSDILMRQRGNQYGFGDDPNSEDLITRNLSEALLDDGSLTNTKSIENFFGNLDRELKKIGQNGFSKANNDLIIKYFKDLIESQKYSWRKKANKSKARELDYVEKEFTESQNRLIENNINENDAVSLTQKNRILKCITLCKKKHDGPITTTEELKALVKKFEKDEKLLNYSVSAEIRLRKLTLTHVKVSCPLFRQTKISIKEKINNLKLLIECQLNLKVQADMADLGNAINGQQPSLQSQPPPPNVSTNSICVD